MGQVHSGRRMALPAWPLVRIQRYDLLRGRVEQRPCSHFLEPRGRTLMSPATRRDPAFSPVEQRSLRWRAKLAAAVEPQMTRRGQPLLDAVGATRVPP